MKALGANDPRQIGSYRVFGELGRGGMGRVVLAGGRDGRLVALKLVHAQHMEDPGFRERFRREVNASRRVSGAYTAAVVDADAEAELPWLATVFVPGPSLREAVEAAGALSGPAALRLAAGLAAALGEIHAAGLVHRDLKPSNVLLAADGPRVIDFGVARATDGNTSELTHTGWLIGSPGYMSPEQAESKTLTPASDIFSLGAVLYLACTGVDPFMGASTPATLYNVVHSEPDLEPLVEPLRSIIEACIAKNPAARPTPAEVLARIGSVPPAARAWPEPVYELIARQDADVVAALGESEQNSASQGTIVLPGSVAGGLGGSGGSADGAAGGSVGGAVAAGGAGGAAGPVGAAGAAGAAEIAETAEAWLPQAPSYQHAPHPPQPLPPDPQPTSTATPYPPYAVEVNTEPGLLLRRRRTLASVGGVAVVAAAGVAAALLMHNSATPSATSSGSAAPPVSSSESSVPTSSPSAPSSSANDTTSSSSSSTPPPTTPSSSQESTSSSSAPQPPPPQTTSTHSQTPACLSGSQAYTLAKQLNSGQLPSDASVSVLKCDGGWAVGRLSSASVGNAKVVYVVQDGSWKAVDLGSDVCGGPVSAAPATIRNAVNCS